jgi:hypothetical protein
MQPDIIATTYEVFSDVERPMDFTEKDHCEECEEHNEIMNKATLRGLTATDMGGLGWSPLSFLTPEAFAYFMPRLLELGLNGELDKHNEPFLFHLLLNLTPTERLDRFADFSPAQCRAVLEILELTKDRHEKILKKHCYLNDMEDAISYWNARANN